MDSKFSGFDTIPVNHFVNFIEESLRHHEQGLLAEKITTIVVEAVRAIQKDWESEYIEREELNNE